MAELSENFKKAREKSYFKPGEQQVINAKKAGKKGAEANKRKKAIKDVLKMVVELKPNDSTIRQLVGLGIPEEQVNLLTTMIVGLSNKASKGDVKAFKLVSEYLGEDEEMIIKRERFEREMALKQAEYELRLKELELREKEFEYKLQRDRGEVEEEDRVTIIDDTKLHYEADKTE